MNRLKLTKTAVEKLKFPAGAKTKTGKPLTQIVFWDTDLPGFGIRMTANSNTKTYVLQQRVKGSKQERNISLGRHGEPTFRLGDTARTYPFGVEDARAKALTLLAQMLSGVDPVEAEKQRQEAKRQQDRQDEAQNVSLRQIMEHYIEHKRTKYGPLRPKTKHSIRDAIERYLSEWLDKPMAATVTRDACLVRFTELSDSEVNQKTGKKGKKGAANLTMTYLRALANHARDLYENEDGTPTIFVVNPVTRMIKVRKLNPEKARKDRVPRDRIGAVWLMLRRRAAAARMDAERTAADWVSTVLLTGMRLSESGALRRMQVDLETKRLRLLGDVADAGDGFAGVKNHCEIVLPLSEPLHEILSQRLKPQDDTSPAVRRRRRARSSEYVFPSFGKKKPYISDARATMEALSQVAGCHCSMHSLRRTYEDVLRYAKVDPDVRRILTNHVGGDIHQVSYANDDSDSSLRPAVEAAAAWILEQAAIVEAQESGANVLPFTAKKG